MCPYNILLFDFIKLFIFLVLTFYKNVQNSLPFQIKKKKNSQFHQNDAYNYMYIALTQ